MAEHVEVLLEGGRWGLGFRTVSCSGWLEV